MQRPKVKPLRVEGLSPGPDRQAVPNAGSRFPQRWRLSLLSTPYLFMKSLYPTQSRSVQGPGPSPSGGAPAAATPAPITPSLPDEALESYLKRDEASPHAIPGLQARTSDLIAKLDEGTAGLSLQRLSLGDSQGAYQVLKELKTAKASLDRAQALLLAS